MDADPSTETGEDAEPTAPSLAEELARRVHALVGAAEAEARRLRSEAETESRAVRALAEAEARRLLDEARTEAAAIRADAERDARSLVDREMVGRIRAAAELLRREIGAAAEAADVAAAHARLLDELAERFRAGDAAAAPTAPTAEQPAPADAPAQQRDAA